jgi:hypothetical protein
MHMSVSLSLDSGTHVTWHEKHPNHICAGAALPIIVHNVREILEKRATKEGLAFSATRHSIAGLLAESGAW